MQLDVESLRAFAAVLDYGGMTRAAEQLGLTQSAVSWKIKRLEERVGRDLLIRDGRSLRPSRDGKELLIYARTILGAHDEAVARLSSSDLTGRIAFGTTEEVSVSYLTAVLGRFNRIHPGVNIEVRVNRGSRLEDLLARGEIDVAMFQVYPEDVVEGDVVLWSDEQVWIAAPDWTYDDGVVPLVTFGEAGFYRPLAERVLGDAEIPFRVAFSGPSTASVLAAVEAGLGVAVISERSVSGEVIPWPRAEGLPNPPSVYQIARSAKGERSAIVAELISDIEGELANPPDEPSW